MHKLDTYRYDNLICFLLCAQGAYLTMVITRWWLLKGASQLLRISRAVFSNGKSAI